MTPSARLAAAIELLSLVEGTARPADATTSAYFRDRRFIGSKDRAEIALAVYRAMRRRARLTWRLERAGAEATPTGMILADLLVGEGRALPEVERLFAGGNGPGVYGPQPLSADEMAIMKRLAGRTLEHPEMPEGVAAECPPWAEPELRRALGDGFRAELDALKEPAPLDLRVNVLKAARADVLAQLVADGFAATPTHLSPIGIRLEGRPSIMAHPLYKDGAIEIQDEGSQLVGLIADARPGQEVIDFCAGAGGKTLALAAAMANKGRVIASDVLANRLERARERFRRAGAHNIQTRPLTGESDPWIKRHKGRFDRVLVDAPCSGTGTWRRNPDMRWRSLGPGLAELLPLQARLLDSAARLVKPGGRLVYATCSMLMSENEDHAAHFLETHPDFTLKPVAEIWRDTIWPDGGPEPPSSPYLRLTPARDGTDGFFAAVFARAAPPPAAPNPEILPSEGD
jgi:16S rRNA (cytosine967-C5)-methyltransferase